MFQNFPNHVFGGELVRVNPHTLAHQEGIVAHFLFALDFKPFEQLVNDKIDLAVEFLEKEIDVSMAADGDAGQVDRSKGEVAPSEHDFPGGVVGIGHDTGTASHVGTFGIGIARLIIFEIKRSIDKRKIREETLGADPAGEFKQVVVGLTRIIVDAVFYFKDMNGEDGSFPISQACFGGEQDVTDNHAAFRGGVQAVVDGTERDLCSGAGMHSIQIMYQRLHRLIGGAVGLHICPFASEGEYLIRGFLPQNFSKLLSQCFIKAVIRREDRCCSRLFFDRGDQGFGVFFRVGISVQKFQRPR